MLLLGGQNKDNERQKAKGEKHGDLEEEGRTAFSHCLAFPDLLLPCGDFDRAGDIFS